MEAWIIRCVGALALIATPLFTWSQAASSAPRLAVYHVQDSREQATRTFMYLLNHLSEDREVRITVIGHAGGVDFMLKGAMDRNEAEYEPAILELQKTGRVSFVACGLTLGSRDIRADQLVPGVQLVPSGVARIAQLQQVGGAAYLRP